MALNLNEQAFESAGSKMIVDNAASFGFTVFRPTAATPPSPSAVVASVQQTLVGALPTPPAVLAASATITASMPPAATLAGAALVRAAQGDPDAASSTVVVDFQGQRTVSELVAQPGATITSVQPWLGTKFDSALAIVPFGGGPAVSFPELQTERLLVTFSTAVVPAVFAQGGSVVIPTPPSNVELLVNDTRVWFNAGPALGKPFTAAVDITDAVATVAATGQAVVLTLRASAPAALTLAGVARLLERYPVAFPEGVVRTVDAPTEGVYPLSLPIAGARPDAAGAENWQVQRVVLDVSAKIPPVRVLPPDGPRLSPDAELVLDSGHALVVQLPPDSTSRLAAVNGVRLPVSAGPDGAELAGTLRGGTRSAPGDVLPKGALAPVTLPPPERSLPAGPSWIDLTLATPHPLLGGDVVWLELQVARGSVVWKLAVPEGDPDRDAPLRRRTSSGTYVELSAVVGIPAYSGALRVVGQERPNDPLPAVTVSVAAGTSTVAGVPTPAGATMILGLAPPAATASVAGSGDRELPLELTISTPGSYAVTSAEVQYTQSTSEA